MPVKQGPTAKIKPPNKATLERLCQALRAQQIDVLDWAIEALGSYFDAHGGNLLLPLNFARTFQVVPLEDGSHRVFHEPLETSGNDPEPRGQLSSSRTVPVKPSQRTRGKQAVRGRG